MPIEVNGDSERENHFNLMWGEAAAVNVSFFSQKCFLVGDLTTFGPTHPSRGKVLRSTHIKDAAAQSLPGLTA